MISESAVTSRQVARLNTQTAAYLTASSRVRPAGTVSRPRSVPWLASPAIASPVTTAMASGSSSSVSVRKSTTSARNTPFPESWLRNCGPLPPPPAPPECNVSRRTMPKKTGTIASTPSRARLRGRKNTKRSSEKKNRNQVGTGFLVLVGRSSGCSGIGRAAASRGGSARWSVDIEALACQLNELVFQAALRRLEPGDGHASPHQLLVDNLRQQVAEFGGHLAPAGRHAGHAEPREYPGRQVRLGSTHQQPPCLAVQLGQRPGEHQLAGPHDAHVRADLLDLGEQVRRHEHGGAIGGDLPDQRPDL